MISENLQAYYGKPVVDFGMDDTIEDFSGQAIRIRCSYDEPHTLSHLLSRLSQQSGVETLEALVFGVWMEGGEAVDVSPDDAIEHLVTEKEKFCGLKALFVGDIISEENEISWINQGNMAPIWSAFPDLVQFGTRGSDGLSLGRINHPSLTQLVIETGGMPRELLQEALEANAPLNHLELWLGTDEYGGTTTLKDLEPLLDGELFPDLRYLGLRNCDFGDELAEAVSSSAVLGRIDVLDLSLGTVSDRGARALLDSGRISHLSLLDLSHHYIGEETAKDLSSALESVRLDWPQTPDNWDGEDHYYVSVSE